MFFCLYVCVPHACNTCGGQKRALDTLILELQMLWAIPGYYARAGRALDCSAICPFPSEVFYLLLVLLVLLSGFCGLATGPHVVQLVLYQLRHDPHLEVSFLCQEYCFILLYRSGSKPSPVRRHREAPGSQQSPPWTYRLEEDGESILTERKNNYKYSSNGIHNKFNVYCSLRVGFKAKDMQSFSKLSYLKVCLFSFHAQVQWQSPG